MGCNWWTHSLVAQMVKNPPEMRETWDCTSPREKSGGGSGSMRSSEPSVCLCSLLDVLFLLSLSPVGYKLATAARDVTLSGNGHKWIFSWNIFSSTQLRNLAAAYRAEFSWHPLARTGPYTRLQINARKESESVVMLPGTYLPRVGTPQTKSV